MTESDTQKRGTTFFHPSMISYLRPGTCWLPWLCPRSCLASPGRAFSLRRRRSVLCAGKWWIDQYEADQWRDLKETVHIFWWSRVPRAGVRIRVRIRPRVLGHQQSGILHSGAEHRVGPPGWSAREREGKGLCVAASLAFPRLLPMAEPLLYYFGPARGGTKEINNCCSLRRSLKQRYKQVMERRRMKLWGEHQKCWNWFSTGEYKDSIFDRLIQVLRFCNAVGLLGLCGWLQGCV